MVPHCMSEAPFSLPSFSNKKLWPIAPTSYYPLYFTSIPFGNTLFFIKGKESCIDSMACY